MANEAKRCSQNVLEENVLRLQSTPFLINVNGVWNERRYFKSIYVFKTKR